MKNHIEKLKAKWHSFIDNITPIKLFFTLFAILSALALISLFIWLCQKLAAFIVANYELLLLCGSIVIGVVYYVWCKRENQKATQCAQLRTQMSIEEESEKRHIEDTYIRIQELLYLVINDTAIITKIPHLKSVASLEAPTHFVQANGFYVFQYLVAKDTATTSNIAHMKEILNNRIRQALNAEEIICSEPLYFSNNTGKPYQRIMIHEIRDNGSFVQLNVVIVGATYVNHVERARLVTSITPADNSDLDF